MAEFPMPPRWPVPPAPFRDPGELPLSLKARVLVDYRFICTEGEKNPRTVNHVIAAYDKAEARYLHTLKYPDHKVEEVSEL